MTLAKFIETVAIYSDATVVDACRAIARRDNAFPPSAGELRAECERVHVRTAPLALPPPRERHAADAVDPKTKAVIAAAFKKFADDLKRETGVSRDKLPALTREAAATRLVAQIGQAAFDALPDRRG